MKLHSLKFVVALLFISLVFISGCVSNAPINVPTKTVTVTTTETKSTSSSQEETSSAETSTTQTSTTPELPTSTATETITEPITQTNSQTETSTEAPTNESIQYDEDGKAICIGDDPDLGCEVGETNENGTGAGFSVGIFNVTFEPVLTPVYRITGNFTLFLPLTSEAFEPNGRIIRKISLVTSSADPGKNVKFTITFENESLALAYVHMETFMNPFTGEKVTYEPTILEFYEGGDFGRRWEVHLYSTLSGDSGYFTVYNVTEDGLEEIQRGNVEINGASVSFNVENFSRIFPESVYLKIRGKSINDKQFPPFTYPKTGRFVVEGSRGLIDYYTSAWFSDGEISLQMEAKGYDLVVRLYFSDRYYSRMMPVVMYIDSSDNGEADWTVFVHRDEFQMKDSAGSTPRSGSVNVAETPIGKSVEFTIENFFSLVPWRYFRLWFSGSAGLERFPEKSNIWVNATHGLTIEKDVDRYLVVLVEDVYIKGNKDSTEGEIQLVSWAFPVTWEGSDENWKVGPIFAVDYPFKRWIEAEDHSRLLYHDERAISVNYPFINGYPIFVMPMEEVEKWKKVYVQTAGWDLDNPGKYLELGTGFLIDTALGLATGEISTAVKYSYSGAMLINQLVTGASASDFWGSRIFEALGAEPDRVGYNGYAIDLSKDYRDGVLIEVWEYWGNMRVTYFVQEVEVPRTLRYDRLGAYLPEVSFTKDTEWGDDEYYLYARAFTHFAPEESVDVPDIVAEETTGMIPVEATHRYPSGKRVIAGNKVTVRPELKLIEHTMATVPFLYLEYNAWEEDAGNWGNDDDPMGQVAITILFDDDYFDWEAFSGIPKKEWSMEFPSCGVSGGCSKVWLWVRVKPEN
ncbi:hypothetical protein VFC49_01335 [Thermococcus sp. SY098]|uniref:hypothetical protein n=1 Tax=Thermococcus sp. SY098 TaxID=3111325 RepID=UPI002D776624|nr:hypothetical protein [Thermococcus sp. SY098]WRS52834.1 hypothetical protein VFC49_01335 [Thermococcus sp. SY098]